MRARPSRGKTLLRDRAQRRNGEMTRQVGAADARDQRAMGGTAPPSGKMPSHGSPRPAALAQDRSQRDPAGISGFGISLSPGPASPLMRARPSRGKTLLRDRGSGVMAR